MIFRLVPILLIVLVSCHTAQARNVVLLIGDGMGPAQIEAGNCYLYGTRTGSIMQTAPYRTTMATNSANNTITDSAASATAMSTGHAVNNDVIAKAIPGDGGNLKTILEQFIEADLAAGVVSTANITNATPAAFVGHAANRYDSAAIGQSIVAPPRPSLIFGGGGSGLTTSMLQSADYIVATNRNEMLALSDSAPRVATLIGNGYLPYEYDGYPATVPHLGEMALKALDWLDAKPGGFFLMIEGARIDHAGHANDIARLVGEMEEFENTVALALDWIAGRNDTLVIVTADHETGGLRVITPSAI